MMKRKLAGLIFAGVLCAIAAPHTALADAGTYTSAWNDGEGHIIEIIAWKDGGWSMIITDMTTGKREVLTTEGNPNPEDAKGTGHSLDDIVNGLKKKGYRVETNPERVAYIANRMNRAGKGMGAHGNPNPGGSDGRGAPAPKNNNGPTQAEIDRARAAAQTANYNARTGQNMNNDMSGGLGGGGEGPGYKPGGKGGKGGGNTDNSSYKDGQNKTIGKTESLGPKPEVVNPQVRK